MLVCGIDPGLGGALALLDVSSGDIEADLCAEAWQEHAPRPGRACVAAADCRPLSRACLDRAGSGDARAKRLCDRHLLSDLWRDPRSV
jgi:hypothetical protein